MPRTRLLLALPLAALAATTATAESHKPTLLDFFNPDRIAARLLQMGLMGLRTQMDVTYGGLSVSALNGSATLTDIVAWPPVDWEVDESCKVTFDRLQLDSVPWDDLDLIRLKAQASGGTATLDCLPPQARGGAAMLGLETISLPRVTLDADYRISTAAATFHAYAQAEALAAATIDVDLAYAWIDGSKDLDRPDPVAFLNAARLTVENLGAWEKLSGMLPSEVTDPAKSGPLVDQFLSGLLGEPREGQTASPERAKLAESVKAAWAGFLADPRRLVIETGFPAGSARFLNLKDWDRNPEQVLDDLEPRAALLPAPARAILPAALITKALDTPDALTDAERVQVGTAFATGDGAPRDLAAAERLLGAAIDNGNGEAALVLAHAIEIRDPARAYALALTAGEQGVAGATSILDRLESSLPLKTVLTLQGNAVEGVEQPVEALAQLSSVRDEAVKRLSGIGRSRSYGTALIWALIGSAAGDPESADILADIDARMRNAGPEAAEVWAKQEADAVGLARSAWTGFDLPARFGGVK